MNKQQLGWIGASIAAGIFPTFQMSFAPDTLASPTGTGDREEEQAATPELAGGIVPPTNFTSGESVLCSAG